MERRITKQIENGYRESLEQSITSFNWDEPLPKNMCFYKPVNKIEENKLSKLEKSGKLIRTVKRNGLMNIFRQTKKFGLEVYSRKMDLQTGKFPHIEKELLDLPMDTILLGEIIIQKNGKDSLATATSICRSDLEECLKKQQEIGLVNYYVFDVAYMGGENLLTTKTYKERINIINQLCKNKKYIEPVEIINKTTSEALEEMIERELEGLVIWNGSEKMKSNECHTTNGKAYRPNLVWKRKPYFEDDFIVRWDPSNGIGDYGKGKNKNRVGKVFLYQLDENGNEVYISKCGGGLSDPQRILYTTAEYPRVWCVKYDSIQPKTGSLQYPNFVSDRTLLGDKAYNECLLSEEIINAKLEEGEDDDENDDQV